MDSKDEISKLLGQFKLQGFPYRSFGRDEAGASGGLKSTYAEQQIEAPSAVPESVEDIVIAEPLVSNVSTSIPDSVVASPALEVCEERVEVKVAEPAPRLNLDLNLPKTPVPAVEKQAASSEPSLNEIFDRLRQTGTQNLSGQARGPGK